MCMKTNNHERICIRQHGADPVASVWQLQMWFHLDLTSSVILQNCEITGTRTPTVSQQQTYKTCRQYPHHKTLQMTAENIMLDFPCDGTSSAERTRCLCTATGHIAPRIVTAACSRTLQRTDSSSSAAWKAFSGHLDHQQPVCGAGR